ncbi:MAG TPA: hypothetical protein VGG68_09275 [Caulobacteraceae bacterium]|jgi:hypothetical protein
MLLVVLAIGVVLIVSAVRNSYRALFTALGTDIPSFVVWAAAILAVGAVGFVPGLRPVSRGVLALVLLVLILRNYQQIIAGFQSAWTSPPAAAGASSSASSGAAAGSSVGQAFAPLTASLTSPSSSGSGGFGAGLPDLAQLAEVA